MSRSLLLEELDLRGLRELQVRLTLRRGLNLVYGPNEAGKSTAKAAVDALFFPESGREDLAEGVIAGRLLVGGEPKDIRVRRRALELPASPGALASWVGDASARAAFQALFCVAHEELTTLTELLGRDGTLGAVLLHAQTGARDLSNLAERLDASIKKLIPGRYSEQVNATARMAQIAGQLALLQTNKDRAKDLDDLVDNERRARAEAKLEESKRRHASDQAGKWRNLAAQLDLVGEHRRLLAEAAAIRELGPFIPAERLDGFVANHEKLLEAQRDERQTLGELEGAQSSLDGLADPSGMLAEAPAARALLDRQAQYAAAEQRVSGQRDAHASRGAELTRLLRSFELPEALATDAAGRETLAVDSALATSTRDHLELLKSLRERRRTLTDESAKGELERQRLIAQQSDAPAPKQLEQQLEASGQLASSSAERRTLDAACDSAARKLADQARLFGLDAASREVLRRALDDAPSEAQVAALVARVDGAKGAHKQKTLDLQKVEREQTALEAQLAKQQAALGSVVDAEQLRVLRAERDRAIEAARAAPSAAAIEAIARSVGDVDRALDERFAHAEEVGKREKTKEDLEAKRLEVKRAIDDLAAAAGVVATETEAQQTTLEAFPNFVNGKAPIAEFSVRVVGVKDSLRELEEAEAARARFLAEVARSEDALRAVLEHSGSSRPVLGGAELRAFAIQRLEELRRAHDAQARVADDLRELELKSARLPAELATNAAQIEEAGAALARVLEGFPRAARDVPMSRVGAWLDHGTSLVAMVRELENYEQASALVADYEREVAALRQRLTLTHVPFASAYHGTTGAFLKALREALDDATKLATRRDAARASIVERKSKHDTASQAAKRAADALSDELNALSLPPDELDSTISRSKALKDLAQQLRGVEAKVTHAVSRPFADVVSELEGETHSSLEGRVEAFERAAAEAQEHNEAAAGEAAKFESQLAALRDDTRDDVATVAQRRASLEVAREAAAREVLVKELAIFVIEKMKQRMATDSGPRALLEDAGRLMAALTEGRYVSLEIDDEASEDSLIIVNGNGATTPVPALSEGTRHQLALALRLAGIAHHVTQPDAHRWPLILDDVLVHFDETRARAGLAALAQLTAQTGLQVVLFTHHQHIVELAAGVADPTAEVHVVTLGVAPLRRVSVPLAPAGRATQRRPAEPTTRKSRRSDSADEEREAAFQQIASVLSERGDSMSKAEILEALDAGQDEDFAKLISAVINAERGDGGRLTKTGKAKGTRYALATEEAIE